MIINLDVGSEIGRIYSHIYILFYGFGFTKKRYRSTSNSNWSIMMLFDYSISSDILSIVAINFLYLMQFVINLEPDIRPAMVDVLTLDF